MSKFQKSDDSQISIFAVIILVLIVVSLGGTVMSKFFGNSDKNEDITINNDTIVVNMSDPDDDNYGKMYYAPIDEGHITTENDSIQYIDNEILIVAKDGTSRTDIEALASSYNAEIVGEIEITGDYQLRFNNITDKNELSSLIEEIKTNDLVETATLNYVSEIAETKQTEERNGFYYGKKWQGDLQNFNNAKGKSWGIEAIGTLGAWDLLTHTSRDVVPVKIGLIDTGFDVSHEDLNYAEVFYDNGSNGLTSNDIAHGTHVSGTMAASNNNNTGICGVYPYGSGRLYGVSNCGNQGAVKYNVSLMAQKISYAELIVRDVKVINVSQGFNWYSGYKDFSKWYMNTTSDSHFDGIDECSDFLADFFKKMLDKGYDFVIVMAAGNDSRGLPNKFDASYSMWENRISQKKYPEVYDRIIVVGAVDYKLNVAAYSNGGDRVDIYAPGGDTGWGNKEIYSTLGNSKYGTMHGTSMAAPHVAGVAAMVWSANNSLTGAKVKEAVCHRGNARCTSCKLLDAYVAVEYALGKEDNSPESHLENGGVLCYVVEKNNESVKISNAEVIMVNTVSGDRYTTSTDDLGHFELMVPDGTYTLSVKASGYVDYNWPDGNTTYQNPIVVRSKGINYLDDWIKMTKDPAATTTGATQTSTEATTTTQSVGTPQEGEVNTNDDEFFEFIEDDYFDYDYGVPLEDMIAWEYYNGHLYALFDYSLSAHVMSLLTAIDPSVHLVTISDAAEQAAVEDLIAVGGRDIYYTGGMVDSNGKLYWISGEQANYSNWYTGCPDSYNEPGYDDIVVIYRGSESPARNDSDFGVWIEVLEDEWSYLDIFDSSFDGVTCGIIIEWDHPESYGFT